MQDQINSLMERVLLLELALLDRKEKKKESKEAIKERVRKHRANKKRMEEECLTKKSI